MLKPKIPYKSQVNEQKFLQESSLFDEIFDFLVLYIFQA